jgi:hypothetical protein
MVTSKTPRIADRSLTVISFPFLHALFPCPLVFSIEKGLNFTRSFTVDTPFRGFYIDPILS